MRFTKVDEVPKKRAYHRLKDDLERFMQSGLKVARIDFHPDEYKSARVAASVLKAAIKRHGLNGITVIQRGDNVYLENNM
jgi:hypothetical protein